MPTYEITGPDGRKFKITGPNKEGALAALQAQLAGAPTPQEGGINPDTDGPMEGFGAAFKQGIDAPLENIGETLEVLGATDAGANLRGLTDAPEGYASASERFINDPAGEDKGFGWRYLPKAVVEQAGQLGGSLITRAGGAAVGAAAGSVIPVAGTTGGAAVGAFAGPALFEAIQVLGPVANARARNDGRDKPNLEDFVIASGTSAGMGALNAIGVRGGSGLTSALREGGTEALQSATEQTGSTVATEAGLSVDPRQAVGEGIIGGASMGTIGAAKGAINRATPAPREDTPEARAEATFAQRIQGITEANGIDLRDVDTASTTGAREAVDKAHVQIAEDLKQTFSDLKGLVKPTDLDALGLVQDKVLAQAAYREGRNKTKNVVGKQEFDALDRLTGQTLEGQRALNLLREMNVLTKIHNDGYKGGLSQYTDTANPFDTSQNTYNAAAQMSGKVLGPLATATAAYSTGGTSIPIQAGVALGGRGIDKVTGRRSRLARFVKQNANNPGIETPTGLPSIRQGRIDEAAEAQRAQEAKAADAAARTEALKQTNLNLAKKGAPPVPTSPQGTVEAATGLDRSGVARILRVIQATNQDPLIQNAIKGYRGTVAVGGRVPDINPLIRAINQMVESQPAFKEMRVREPDTGTAQAATAGSPIQTTSENYQRGIDDNKAMLQDLKDGVKTDPTMSLADKAKVSQALDQLGMNLGSDPAAKVNEIMGTLEGVEPDAVAQYVEPYVMRVMGQQDAAARNSAPRPALQSFINPLNIPDNEIDVTRLNSSPSEADIQKMREGTYKPETKRTLVEAADYMYQKWKAATGRDEAFEYTPENVDIISSYMATEAVNALQSDANAIGWYDRKLKAAKRVVSLVEPRVTQSADAEAAFDFALAVTSNGQAVSDNFQYALEVFRHFIDNGQMPTNTWKKGGERNAAMLEAFDFFNAYQSSGANMPIQDFLDGDFTVNELNDYIARFNEQYDTNIKVPSSEGANSAVKGSYIIGPKIGQGFYQNIRGNYDPLTMDIWWMRMWNRHVGRPFEANKDLDKNRARVRKALQTKNQDALEKRLTKETLKDMDLTRADLKNNDTLDEFVLNLESRYQSFYRQESKRLKGTGQKVPKPELANATGTMKRNLSPQLQATPKGPGERAYMRDVTKAAIAKLGDLGYNIETADFQALMWYPEKQLFRHLGVAPGRGADNDYLDAAIILAEAEGITNDQIQEALPNADGDGAINNQPGSKGVDEGLYRGPSGTSPGQARQSVPGPGGILSGGANPSNNPVRSRAPEVPEVKQETALVNASIEIGKPGSEFENGIKDMAGVEKLAAAYDIALKFYNSNPEMRQAVPSAAEGWRGAYIPRKRTANVVSTGDLQELITALHETMHGVGVGNIATGNFLGETRTTNGLTGQADVMGINSLESVMDFVLGKDKSDPVRREILAELKHIQERAMFFTGGVQAPIRGSKSMSRTLKIFKKAFDANGGDFEGRLAEIRKQLKDHQNYERSIGELTVDALQLYAHDPKTMKRVAPQTARMIRELFQKSGNKKIQFYSHPLAMVVAVVMAIMAKAGTEDEEEQQLPPGMLSPQPGMLTA